VRRIDEAIAGDEVRAIVCEGPPVGGDDRAHRFYLLLANLEPHEEWWVFANAQPAVDSFGEFRQRLQVVSPACLVDPGLGPLGGLAIGRRHPRHDLLGADLRIPDFEVAHL